MRGGGGSKGRGATMNAGATMNVRARGGMPRVGGNWSRRWVLCGRARTFQPAMTLMSEKMKVFFTPSVTCHSSTAVRDGD